MTALDDCLREIRTHEAMKQYVTDRLGDFVGKIVKYKAHREEYDFILPVITPVYSDMPKGTSLDFKGDRVADDRWRHREKLDKERDSILADHQWMIRHAGRLEAKEESTIILHYMCGKTFERIAEVLECELRTVYRYNRQGIEKIVDYLCKCHCLSV